jgi:RNA polymerase sigma-70 factor (ECF subfamily)
LLIDHQLLKRCYGLAHASRWQLPEASFAEALEQSIRKAFPDGPASGPEIERFATGLHLEDLALACACAGGDEPAWDHFVATARPSLYRAADALDPAGGAREIADSLYAELFGLTPAGERRPSLFGYFHGRSALTTWLRSMLAQRYVDRLRAQRRTAELPDDESSQALSAENRHVEPDRERFVSLMAAALRAAVASLPPGDRLRLGCYYAQGLTLAQIGKALGEHEATVSRSLARTRKSIRQCVERELSASGLSRSEIDECFASIASDSGSLSMQDMLG